MNCSITDCKMYLIQLQTTMHNISSNGSAMNDCIPAIANTTIQNALKSVLKSLAIAIIWEVMIEQNRDTVPPRRHQSLTNENAFILPEIKQSAINQTEKILYLHIINPLNISKCFHQWCNFQYNNYETIDQLIKLFYSNNKCNIGCLLHGCSYVWNGQSIDPAVLL